MNKQLLYYYINNPKELNETSLFDIQQLVDEYPFFQTARLLLLKNLHQLDHIRFEPELKKSAMYVSDRTRLFELIHDLYPKADSKPKPSIQEEERPEVGKGKTSSIDISGKVGSLDNYFGIDGVNETIEGGAVGFTFQANETKGGSQEESTIPDNQLFEYEKAGGLAYSLNIYEHSLDVGQNRSFSDWLSAVGQQPADNADDKHSKTAEKKNKSVDIIEGFLNNQQSGDKVLRHAEASISKEIKEPSSFDSDDLMTETLAGIYIKQGHYVKAINIFEKLSLKYPEKSVYFAQQIKKVEELISNQ